MPAAQTSQGVKRNITAGWHSIKEVTSLTECHWLRDYSLHCFHHRTLSTIATTTAAGASSIARSQRVRRKRVIGLL